MGQQVPRAPIKTSRPWRTICAAAFLAALAIGALGSGRAAAADPLQVGDTGERNGDSITLHAVGEGNLFCYPRPELAVAFPPCSVGEGTVEVDPSNLLVDITYCVGAGNPSVQPMSLEGPGIDDLFAGEIGRGATGLGGGFEYRYPGDDITQQSLSQPIGPGSCMRGFLPFQALGAPQLIWGDPSSFDEAVVWQIGAVAAPATPTPDPTSPPSASATAVPAPVGPTPAPSVQQPPDPVGPVPLPALAAPGALVASIPIAAAVSADPPIVLQSALLALAVIFLMPFPAQLFNSTVEEHHTEIRGWFAPVTRGFRAAGKGVDAFWRSPIGIGLFLVVSAVLYALLDPAFAVAPESLITLLGLAVGIVLVTTLFAIPAVLWHRRQGDRPAVEAIPGTLLVAVACVAVSRLADFQPGYLYGLVIGLAFARELNPRDEGRSGAAAAGLMLTASILSWLGLGLLVESSAVGFGAALAETVLAVVMVAGLEGVAFGLLPLRFLPGEPVYAWNRIVWGALIGIGLFAFFHILINPSTGYLADTSRTPLLVVLGLLVGFGLASIAFWAYFRFRPARLADAGSIPPE